MAVLHDAILLVLPSHRLQHHGRGLHIKEESDRRGRRLHLQQILTDHEHHKGGRQLPPLIEDIHPVPITIEDEQEFRRMRIQV